MSSVISRSTKKRDNLPVFPKQMNIAYILQSSFILYFFNAAGRTFQQGSSSVTRKDFAAAVAEAVALAEAELVEAPAVADADPACLSAAFRGLFEVGSAPPVSALVGLVRAELFPCSADTGPCPSEDN